jgi:5-formyltetrahydrofolate cyclo-ligase
MPVTKRELRRKLAALRAAMPRELVAARSTRIAGRLLREPEVREARSVFIYVSSENEVETHDLIRTLLAGGKTVTVPRITGAGIMEASPIGSWEDLAPGEFGILAPRRPQPAAGSPEVTVCPGVAFTLRGDRLGRGQAYYDRYLAGHPDTFAIGLAFEDQLVGEIPTAETDRPVVMIVTERQVYRLERR